MYFNVRPPKICVDHPAYQLGDPLGDQGFFISHSPAIILNRWRKHIHKTTQPEKS